MKQHEVGDVIACSPWIEMSPSYEERVVLRLYKDYEYAVHRESLNTKSEHSHYFWGYYFGWNAGSEHRTQEAALTRATNTFLDRAREHLNYLVVG